MEKHVLHLHNYERYKPLEIISIKSIEEILLELNIETATLNCICKSFNIKILSALSTNEYQEIIFKYNNIVYKWQCSNDNKINIYSIKGCVYPTILGENDYLNKMITEILKFNLIKFIHVN